MNYFKLKSRSFISKKLMLLIFAIFASIIMTRFLFAGDQMTTLPVTIESKVVWVEDKSFLLLKIINKFPERIIISKDFLDSSFWDIWILEEDVKKGETNIKRLGGANFFL